MLTSLYIKNIAVIEEASLDFSEGFTVMTGETGAGKSIIIDAISAILGGRTSKDLIRTGSDSAFAAAMFSDVDSTVTEKLKELMIPTENNEVYIQREIRASRNTAKVNGVPVTVAMLKELGNLLISIHGQHDSYELLSPEIHMDFVDAYAEDEKLLAEYKASYSHLREIQHELEKLNVDEEQKSRKIDLLNYQIGELSDAGISIGEKDELTSKRDAIRNGEAIAGDLEAAKSLLSGEGELPGIAADVERAAELIETAAKNYSELSGVSERLRELSINADDIASEIRDFAENFDFDPTELDRIEQRLDLIYRMSLKYGETESEMLEFLEKAEEELRSIELSDERITILSEEFEKEKKTAIALAKSLSSVRKSAASELSQRIRSELNYLNMPGVEFTVEQERVALNSMGCDRMQFLVSANPGEEAKPMSKIASGGELSRIMLAIKTVLSSKDNISTLIFDEVDTGISGEAANKVGAKLKEVANDHQVICITHLAQIASLADNQMFISKKTENGKTFTSVSKLSREERIHELARIIGGDEITPLKLKMAEEMLDKA